MWHGSILPRLISGLCFPPSFPPPHHCAQHPWALFHDSNLPRTVLACHCDVLSSLPSGCYNGAKIGFCCQSFDPIPRRNFIAAGSKLVADYLQGRETDLEPSGIAGTVRFLDSPEARFMIMPHITHIRLPVTCSEKPAKAGIIIEPCCWQIDPPAAWKYISVTKIRKSAPIVHTYLNLYTS